MIGQLSPGVFSYSLITTPSHATRDLSSYPTTEKLSQILVEKHSRIRSTVRPPLRGEAYSSFAADVRKKCSFLRPALVRTIFSDRPSSTLAPRASSFVSRRLRLPIPPEPRRRPLIARPRAGSDEAIPLYAVSTPGPSSTYFEVCWRGVPGHGLYAVRQPGITYVPTQIVITFIIYAPRT